MRVELTRIGRLKVGCPSSVASLPKMVLPPGLEPGIPRWQRGILPLNYRSVAHSGLVTRPALQKRPFPSGCRPLGPPLDRSCILVEIFRAVGHSFRSAPHCYHGNGWMNTWPLSSMIRNIFLNIINYMMLRPFQEIFFIPPFFPPSLTGLGHLFPGFGRKDPAAQ